MTHLMESRLSPLVRRPSCEHSQQQLRQLGLLVSGANQQVGFIDGTSAQEVAKTFWPT
jgi:hypothetical protein